MPLTASKQHAKPCITASIRRSIEYAYTELVVANAFNCMCWGLPINCRISIFMPANACVYVAFLFFLDALGHHALTCRGGGDAVLLHNSLRDVVAQFCHRARLGGQLEVGGGTEADGSRSWPADYLVPNWSTGKPAAIDITVTSPLNPISLPEAKVTGGSAARMAEMRKHTSNDPKCRALGWVCIPLAVETYGCWGTEGRDSFSCLAARLALQLHCSKSKALVSIYQRLNLTLVRCAARALLSRVGTQTPEHVSHHGPWSSPLDEDVKKITEAISLAKDGLLGKACQILTSSGLAPNTEDTWTQLSAKHPKSPPPVPPAHPPLPLTSPILPPDFNVLSILRSFPKASAAGPTGLRIQHLLNVAEVPVPTSICSLLRGVINLLASGQAPAAISQYMAGGSLVALRKGTQDIRPIAVVFSQGCEKVIHGLRRLDNHWHDSEFVCLKVDMKNAFNLVSRQSLLDQCTLHFPLLLLPWTTWCYGQHPFLWHSMGTLTSEAGVQQGDPLGLFYFALVLHHLVLSISKDESCQDCGIQI
eukprot:Em0011g596a